jgi:hypothetical protein
MAPILESGIPYAHTGGSIIDSFLYQQVDRQFGKDASWSGYKWNLETTRVPGSEKDIGYFTGRIPVMDSTGKFELMSLYTMDTTTFPECSKTLPGKSCLSRYAISWFEEQQDLYAHNNTRRDFMFMHRPIQEFMTLGNMYSITGHKQQAISCQATNTGMFAVAREKMGVGWIGAGGDSNNDFSGNYHDIFLSYGRKSGFGGDGDLLRGARVFNFVKPQYDDMHVTTWVTDENGYRNADMVPHPAPYF